MTYTGTLAAAAVKVAASLGIHGTDPEILNDGANVIVHLSPAPVVAKVAASTPPPRRRTPRPVAGAGLTLSRRPARLGLRGHERCPGSDQ